MKRSLLAVLLVLPLLGSDSPKEYDDRTQTLGIDGTWRIVAAERDGKSERFTEAVITYRAGKYLTEGGSRVISQGTYVVDTSRNPASLDMTDPMIGGGKPLLLIYRVDEDTLWTTNGAGLNLPRPSGFHEKGLIILTFKRVKK
jgi:uncharacterized protein (TIGR03067 family)